MVTAIVVVFARRREKTSTSENAGISPSLSVRKRHAQSRTGVPEFATAWARLAIQMKSKSAFSELLNSPWVEQVRPSLRALLYFYAGLTEAATAIADSALRDLRDRKLSRSELEQLGKYFQSMGRQDDFDTAINDLYPGDVVRDMKIHTRTRPRRMISP